MKTARKSDLTKHMRTMHPKVQWVRCSVCEALFTSQEKLERHQQIHLPQELRAATPPLSKTLAYIDQLSNDAPQEHPLALTKHSPKSFKPKLPIQISGLSGGKIKASPSRSQPKAPLACQYCPRVYTIRRDLIEHERTHTGEKPYQCAKCTQRFHRKSNYFRHRQICKGIAPKSYPVMQQKAVSSQMFGCFYCESFFPDQQSLVRHQRSHTLAKTGLVNSPRDNAVDLKKELDRLFPCKFCNKRFLNRAGLVVHEKSHKGTYAYQCRFCRRRFLTKSGLVTHKNMHLKNQARVLKTEAVEPAPVMDEMMDSAKSEGNVQTEVDPALAGQVHEEPPPQLKYALPSSEVKVNEKVQAYKCRYCSKVCGKYANLLVHEKLHTHGNRYKCKKCGKGFDVRRRLKQHENTHKEYICQICTKSFLRHLQLIRHVKSAHKNMPLARPVSVESSHTGKYKPGKRGLVCMYCRHRFCRKHKRVLSHMRSHRKRYGKYWYIKAANVIPELTYTSPVVETTMPNVADLQSQQVVSHNTGTGQFKCRFCDKVCTRKMYLEQHEVIHTANRRFQCNTCGLKFSKLYQLTRHKKKAHKGTKPTASKMFLETQAMDEEGIDEDGLNEGYEEIEDYFKEEESHDVDKSHICHFCNAVCDTRENLLSHEKSHGPEGQLMYTCKYCPMVFYRRTEYERHERTHTGERPYRCHICAKAFNRTWNLKIHKLNVHGIRSSRFGKEIEMTQTARSPPPQPSEEDAFEEEEVVEQTIAPSLNCQYCGKHMTSESSLKVHERTHLQQDAHQCRVCGLYFSREWNLKKHLEEVHKGRVNAKTCNICQKEFANPSNLRKHLKQVHLVKNPFVSKYSLPSDLPKVTDEPADILTPDPDPIPNPTPPAVKNPNYLYSLKCDKCGKKFRDTFGLRKHKMTFCGGGRRQCHICKQVFSNSSNLNRHIISHTGQKPYKCDICQRGFFQSTHLTRHMSLHSGKRPFACNLCKSNFSSQSLLDHHKMSHTLSSGKNKLITGGNSSRMSNGGLTALADIKGYQCLYCESTFIDEGQLRVHERAHLVELPFRCQTCFKLFETNEALEEHEIEHLGEPFR